MRILKFIVTVALAYEARAVLVMEIGIGRPLKLIDGSLGILVAAANGAMNWTCCDDSWQTAEDNNRLGESRLGGQVPHCRSPCAL